MKSFILLLCLLYTVCAKCPAPFPGEHGPCMKTCGQRKHCSPGLWCCDTPCGGTVCKIPDLPVDRQPLEGAYRTKPRPVQKTAEEIPPAQTRHTPEVYQHHPIPELHQRHIPVSNHRQIPELSQHFSLFQEPSFTQIQNDILPLLLSEPSLFMNQQPQSFTHYNNAPLLGNQPLKQIQTPPLQGFGMVNSCPPDRPRIFCGFDPCHGKTCPLFQGSVCEPDYCGDCTFKFILATVDVTNFCNFQL